MSTKMFKVKSEYHAPKEVTAEIPEYPNLDSEGDKIFVNTHFLTLEEAWPKLLSEIDACLSLYAMEAKRLRSEVGKWENKLADAAIARYSAVENHAEWLRGGGRGEQEG